MVGVVAQPSVADRYIRLARTTGILGLTSVVLLFGPIIALASAGEPPLEATGAEAAEYYGRLDATWRSTVAMLSGALLAAYGLIGSSVEAASVHGAKITPEVADYALRPA